MSGAVRQKTHFIVLLEKKRRITKPEKESEPSWVVQLEGTTVGRLSQEPRLSLRLFRIKKKRQKRKETREKKI